MVRSNNIKKYNRISGKICVLSGASTEATRIKMFLLHNPNPVKIMTNDVTSIKNIFTSPNVLLRIYLQVLMYFKKLVIFQLN